MSDIDYIAERTKRYMLPKDVSPFIADSSAKAVEKNKRQRVMRPLTVLDIADRAIAARGDRERLGEGFQQVPVIGDIPFGFARGALSMYEAGGGLAIWAGRQIGDNTAGEWLTRYGEVQAAASRIYAAGIVPRPEDEAVKAFLGDVAGILPQVAPQIAVAIATGGVGLPVMAGVAAYSGVDSTRRFGAQYLEAYEGNLPFFSEAESHRRATTEATMAALITFGTNAFPGYMLLRKIPGADKYLMASTKRVATRLTQTAGAEGFQESAERVLTDAMVVMLREDPDIFEKVYRSDPSYIGSVLYEGLLGIAAGLIGAGAVEVAIGRKLALGEELDSSEIQILHEAMFLYGGHVQEARLAERVSERVRPVVEVEQTIRAMDEDTRARAEELVTAHLEAPETAPEAKDAASAVLAMLQGQTSETGDVTVREALETEELPAGEMAEPEEARFEIPGLEPTTEKLKVPAKVARAIKVDEVGEWLVEIGAIPNPEGEFSSAGIGKLLSSLEQSKRQAAGVARTEEQVKSAVQLARTEGQITKLKNQIEQAKEKVRGEKAKSRRSRELRIELRRIVRGLKEVLPKSSQDRILASVNKQDVTIGDVAKGLAEAKKVIAEHEHKTAISTLKETLKQARSHKLRPEHQAVVDDILADIDKSKLSEKSIASLGAIREWIEANPAAPMPQRVLKAVARLDKRGVSELSTDEAWAIDAMIRHEMKVSERKETVRIGTRQMELKRLTDSILTEIAQTMGGSHIDPVTGEAVTSKGRRLFNKGVESLLKLENMCEYISGSDETVTADVFYRAIFQGQKDSLSGYYRAMDDFQAYMQELGIEPGQERHASMSTWIAGKFGILESIAGKGPTGRSRADVHEFEFTGGTAKIDAALAGGLYATLLDQDNFDLITQEKPAITFSNREGRYIITVEDAHRFMAEMEERLPVETKLVQRMMDIVNGPIKQAIREYSVEQHGYDITKEGTWFTRHRLDVGQRDIDFSKMNYTDRVLESAGIVQPRTGDPHSPVEIRDFFYEFNNIVWTSYNLRHLSQPIQAAKTVLNEPDVRKAFRSGKALGMKKRFDEVMSELAREVVGSPSHYDPLAGPMRKLFRNMVQAFLGYNPFVWAYQPASLCGATTEIPAAKLSEAGIGGAPFDARIDDRINRWSIYLRARKDQAAIGIMVEAGGATRGVYGKVAAADRFMAGIRVADQMAIRTIWRGCELWVESEGMYEVGSDAFYVEVSERAERVVTRTQPVWDTLHQSGWGLASKRNPFMKVLTPFFSQRNQNVNIMARKAMRAKRNGEWGGLGWAMGSVLLAQSLWILSVKELRRWALKGDPPEGDEEDYYRWGSQIIDILTSNLYFADHLSYTLQRIVFPSQRTYLSGTNPVAELLDDTVSTLTRVVNAIQDEDKDLKYEDVYRLMMDTSSLFGVPATPLRVMLEIYENYIAEEKKSRTGHFSVGAIGG